MLREAVMDGSGTAADGPCSLSKASTRADSSYLDGTICCSFVVDCGRKVNDKRGGSGEGY